jgi:branched-chain amino acid transport system permease protein
MKLKEHSQKMKDLLLMHKWLLVLLVASLDALSYLLFNAYDYFIHIFASINLSLAVAVIASLVSKKFRVWITKNKLLFFVLIYMTVELVFIRLNSSDWDYVLHIVIMINIFTILTMGLNLMVGYTNLLSLSQAAFYGIGGYLSVLGLMILGLTLIPSLMIAVLGTVILSWGIGKVSIRLKGDYFILVTLGFQMIVFAILYNWVSVTKGPYGVPGIPQPELLGLIPIKGTSGFMILSSVLVLLAVWFYYSIIHSPFGRVLKGIRDDEIGVLALGRNVTAFKVRAFVIGSSMAAISGFLYATYVSYIDPTSFTLNESIFIVTAVLIGGAGTIRGSILGAVFVVLVPEIVRQMGFGSSIDANMKQIVYGVILILLMMFKPKGLWGDYEIR